MTQYCPQVEFVTICICHSCGEASKKTRLADHCPVIFHNVSCNVSILLDVKLSHECYNIYGRKVVRV